MSVRFALGCLVLGTAEMVWSSLFAATTWEGMRRVPLWLVPMFVAPIATAGGAGFAAGLWMARLDRRTPRSRFLGWWALGLGAAFFYGTMSVTRAWSLLEAPMRVIGVFLVATTTAAVTGAAFVLIGTSAPDRQGNSQRS